MRILDCVFCGGRLMAKKGASENFLPQCSSNQPAPLSDEKRRRHGNGATKWRPKLREIPTESRSKVHAVATDQPSKKTTLMKTREALPPTRDEQR